eukprot:GHVT01048333.1.p1 GENE.GHVT01048333.1~~GHVT01048333.1.p1  ORF type:complete len:236 (+),score=49.72 GHVT01048333.1:614-1321(+)
MAEEGSESEQCGATAKGPDANIAKPTTASCLQRDSAADPLGGETLGSTAGGSSCGLHKPSSCSGSCSAAPAIRYDFSQSNSSAFVSFYCRNRKQGDVYVHLTETSLHVSIAQTDADNSSTAPSSSAPLAAASSSTASAPFELAIDQLGGRVVVHECKTNISQVGRVYTKKEVESTCRAERPAAASYDQHYAGNWPSAFARTDGDYSGLNGGTAVLIPSIEAIAPPGRGGRLVAPL